LEWESINDVDISKKTTNDWAQIYGVKLLKSYGGFMDEYEWSYNFDNYDFIPFKKDKYNDIDYEYIEQKQLRAQLIKRDIFMGATFTEKKILKNRYTETDWIKKHISKI